MAIGRPAPSTPRQRWTETYMEVFWQPGYEGATIAQLTDAMGINPPSLCGVRQQRGLLKARLTATALCRTAFMQEIVNAPTTREGHGDGS